VIAVSGTAAPGTLVQIQEIGSDTVLASASTSAEGDWQAFIDWPTAGPITLIAVVTNADGTVLTSDPVILILAPPVHPNTGADRQPNREQVGRTFTALLALLLVAGGFSIFFAGRLLYVLAKDRLKPH
jgi:hypothetical protein